MQYEPDRIVQCYRWLETKDNFKKTVTWSGTWIGILGSLTIPYFARHNLALEQYNELKAFVVGTGTYSLGMLVSWINAKGICALGKMREARQQPAAKPMKEGEISDLVK